MVITMALGAAGCAKQQIVKADEPLPVASAPQPKGEVSAERRPDAPKAEPVPVRQEAPAQPAATQQLQATSQAGALLPSLEKIYFDFDSPTLSKDARETLARNAEVMRKDPGLRVQIEGHCDERGSDEYNLALGDKRARAALQYLSALGIPADRLSAISFGKEKPANPEHTEAGWRENRRDEFQVQR